MKVAIFSDIHGNLEALDAILEDIQTKQFDEVICLGDVLGIGPNPHECLTKIRENHIRLLIGNHERFYFDVDRALSPEEQDYVAWERKCLTDEDKSFLESCDLSYKVNNVLFEHFIIEDEEKTNPFASINDEKSLNFKIKLIDAKLIFVGHQHRPFLVDKMVCIGSSGCTKNNKTFYYCIEINDSIQYEKNILYYDRVLFEDKMKKAKYPGKEYVARGFFGII